MKKRKSWWTEKRLENLKKWYPTMSSEQCARKLDYGVEAVKKMASRLGLTKSAKRMATLGRV